MKTSLIDNNKKTALLNLSLSSDTNLPVILLAAFRALCYRYFSENASVAGLFSTSRPDQQKSSQSQPTCLFIRGRVLQDDLDVSALIDLTKSDVAKADYIKILSDKEGKISARLPELKSSEPIPALFIAHTASGDGEKVPVLNAQALVTESIASTIDLLFSVLITDDEIELTLEKGNQSTSFLSTEVMLQHFQEILDAILAQSNQKLAELNMLTPEEKQQFLVNFNKTEVEYPKDLTLVDIIESHISTRPDTVAVVFEEKQVLYAELGNRATQLASYLRNIGVQKGSSIPLYTSRGVEMVIAILGIWKAGCAYVPIDPETPETRLVEVLKDIAARAMIIGNVQEEGLNNILDKSGINIDLINIEKSQLITQKHTGANDQTKLSPDSLAYVIYTSGSTGKPKGVMVQHNHILDYVYGLQQQIGLQECISFAIVSTLAADLGNTVLFGSLFCGGTLHVLSKESVIHPALVNAYFNKHRIDCLKIVPSHWQALCAGNQLLLPAKKIIFGGEALPTEVVERIGQAGTSCQIINHYGPTETTIGKLLYVVQPNDDYSKYMPLGKPFSNTKVYVLSSHRQLCPTGVPGELYIGGDGVARGYLNREELTAERFIRNPFSQEVDDRLYKTGDLVRWMPDGNIEFIGRVDDQVKIRGYRVEPGEIQTVLLQHPSVQQCVVLAKENKTGDKQLVGYIVPKEALESATIKQYLMSKLPEYMIPSRIVLLDAIPLTSNGKIDRKALPELTSERPDVSTLYLAPETITEKRLAGIWESLLCLDRVGVNDNFFELGGSSLMAIKTVAQWREQYQYDLPVARLYQSPTIKGIARFLDTEPQKKSLVSAENQPIDPADHDVAVIGMGMRFPGANTPKEFWDLLKEGREAIRFFSDEELDPNIPSGLKNDPHYVKARGIIDRVEEFDASFFGITPKMAELMDPQQRVFLEISWEALEGAGYIPEKYNGSIGVFAGCRFNSYYLNNVTTHRELIERAGFLQVMTFNDKDYISSRTAYTLNLKGPAVTVQSACSTSLLAIAQAVESIRKGQCTMALAGAAIITVPVNSGHLYQEGAMLSNDGHCRPFDAEAKGTVFSDGAGVVLLKSKKQAERDGDFIYAVIKGVGINNDGGGKGSFTAPSAEGQAGAIKMAIADAGVPPSSISYIEAHGTATPLGDPIEMEGLKMAFGLQEVKQFCALGSVKSNLGHLVTAAGVAGLIKTVLSLHQKQLPPSLFYKRPNPNIDFENSPFYVNNELKEWNAGDSRRAGVSSFGVGGTNVHVVLEEYENINQHTSPSRPKHLIIWSAKTEKSREEYAKKLSSFLKENKDISIADVAYNLQTGKQDFSARRFLVKGTTEELIGGLDDSVITSAESKTLKEAAGKIVFMFPGQGSQHINMGRELYRHEPVFKEALDRCAALLKSSLGEDIRRIIYADVTGPEAESKLKDTRYAQPALFCIEYALAMLWRSWGIEPAFYIGHSIGEFVAAHLAGVFSLADALKMVATRGRMMSSLSRGSMLSVRKEAAFVESLLPPELSIAAINSTRLCVVAGPDKAIEVFSRQLDKQGIANRLLQTSHAFHSPMMEPVIESFEAVVRSIKLNAPVGTVISTVSGKKLTDEEATSSAYWSKHLRVTVRFAEALQELIAGENCLFLEVGPRNVLSTFARQLAANNPVVTSLDSTEGQSDYEAILKALGQLWLNGVQPDWNSFYRDQKRQKLALPTYAFDKKRHWLEPAIQATILPNNPIIPQTVTPVNGAHTNILTEEKVMRKNALVERVKKILEEASGIEMTEVTPDMSFIEIGLDSLLLTQIALTLKKEFNLPITFRQLNEEYGSLNLLASYLETKLPPETGKTQAETLIPAQAPAAPPIQQPLISPAANIGQTVQSDTALGLIAQQLQLLARQVALMQGVPAPPLAPSIVTSPLTTPPPALELSPDEEVEIRKPFGATARIDRQGAALGGRQKMFLDNLIRNYTQKTKKSKEYTQAHRALMADPRVVSGFKPQTKELVYPIVVNQSKGSRLWDLDGNEYIDVLNGFGSNMLGHQPEVIVRALQQQIDKGYEIGPQHELAGIVCRLVCELTGFERTALCSTGSEAVLGAMRIARTVTGKALIVAFTGSYHGIVDEVIVRGSKKLKSFPAAPGIMPEAVQNMLILDYGSEESLKIIQERAQEIAAVLVEPVQSRRPEFQPFEFLKEVRRITENNGVVLIFDEIITGFRMHPQGVQGLTGIRADMATYGKVIGGGLPIGVIAGHKKFMDALDGGWWEFGNESFPEAGVTYFAGTFVRHPLALATAKASLEYMQLRGPALQESLNQKTTWLAGALNDICSNKGLPLHIVHFGSLWKIKFREDVPYGELLFTLMRFKGIHIMDLFPCYMTEAHIEQDLQQIVQAFRDSINELMEAGIFAANITTIENDIRLFQTPPLPGAKLGRDQQGNPSWFVQDPERPGKYMQVNLYE